MKLDKLRIEYQKSPIGLDCKNPRFSWQLISEKNNIMQTAYQIIVRDEKNIVWDTGKILEDTSLHIRYEGASLKAKTWYEVSVDVWDNRNDTDHMEGEFETGLFTGDNFSADWITHTIEDIEACPIFVKDFQIGKTVKKARIYASSLGIYELELNGLRVGDYLFTPDGPVIIIDCNIRPMILPICFKGITA